MFGNRLSIEITEPHGRDSKAVRFAAHGLRDPEKWEYEWRILRTDETPVSPRSLENADDRFETNDVAPKSRFVDWRAADVQPGVYTVHVTASRADSRGPYVACASLEVGEEKAI